MKPLLLAIETSCDETAVSLFNVEAILNGASYLEGLLSEQLASSARLHEEYGGVVPELAAREQTLTLPPLIGKALAGFSVEDIGFVAATAGPGLNGSLLVGLSWAKAFAFTLGVPLLPINHLEGHLSSHELLPEQLATPYLALLVSGGHTEVVLVEEQTKQVLARTRDDAAGEAFDKCATLLGLPYPGGPALSRLAAESLSPLRFNFPVGVPDDPTSFSFSGLKTAVQREVRSLGSLDEATRQDLAAAVQQAIVEALVSKSVPLALKHKATGIFLTGGVAANLFLRERLKAICDLHNLRFAACDLKYTTDNSTMIGAAALNTILSDPETWLNWQSSPGAELGPQAGFAIGTRPSWPI
jgi:N6-L-threonylcarbamoyladenine synthase